jgi:hypothetical protein
MFREKVKECLCFKKKRRTKIQWRANKRSFIKAYHAKLQLKSPYDLLFHALMKKSFEKTIRKTFEKEKKENVSRKYCFRKENNQLRKHNAIAHSRSDRKVIKVCICHCVERTCSVGLEDVRNEVKRTTRKNDSNSSVKSVGDQKRDDAPKKSPKHEYVVDS